MKKCCQSCRFWGDPGAVVTLPSTRECLRIGNPMLMPQTPYVFLVGLAVWGRSIAVRAALITPAEFRCSLWERGGPQ